MEPSENTVVLKIKEALGKDVGRAIARMDPKDMKTAGLEPGDIVIIEGKRKTPVKVMPCYLEARGHRIPSKHLRLHLGTLTSKRRKFY